MLLPTPKDIKERYPLSTHHKEFLQHSNAVAKDIFHGVDKKFVIITGPCSIHDPKAAIEYAKKLSELSLRVSDSCFLIMRVYIEKSRSTVGWKGMLYDPYLDGSDDILTGLEVCRKLLLDITELKVPVALEFVDPLLTPYIDDLVTWGFIGARSCSSQPHRQLSSLLSIPIGFKNTVDGDIISAVEGVISASSPHTFLHVNSFGNLSVEKSEGNPLAHIVLRGGRQKANYDPETVRASIELLKSAEVCPKLIVDCSHGNSQKNHVKQKEVFFSIIDQVLQGNKNIMGVMLESHLYEGVQSPYQSSSSLKYGISITDPCLDWVSTEGLILSAGCAFSDATFSSTSSTEEFSSSK